MFNESGFKISTAGVTQKLVNEIIIPNDIKLTFPKLELKKKW